MTWMHVTDDMDARHTYVFVCMARNFTQPIWKYLAQRKITNGNFSFVFLSLEMQINVCVWGCVWVYAHVCVRVSERVSERGEREREELFACHT